ncbi:phage integrase SAM-like domain-containing protein [Hymenobacter mucosus]|nr:phage integrase SAM-like domain-containing protein [Hymenobacter mucosus]
MTAYKLKMSLRFWRRANREDAVGCAPISLRLTLNGRAEITTNVDVPAAYWGGHKIRVQLPAAKKDRRAGMNADWVDEMNRRLQRIYDELDEKREQYRKKGRPYTAKQVAEDWRGGGSAESKPLRLVELFDQFEQAMQRAALKKSPSTLRSYATRLSNLKLFLQKGLRQPDLLASDVTMQTGLKLEQWSQDHGHNDWTMRKQVNMLQMVLAYAAKHDLLPSNVLYGFRYESAAEATVPVSLPREDVRKLETAVFTDLYLREVADMWLFMYYTGLSYVDYIRYATEPSTFTYRTLVDGNPQDWIRMVRQKMIRRKPEGFSVPILKDASRLLERRRYVLPRLDNAYTNRKLKEISTALELSLPLTCKIARASFSQHHRDQGVSGETVAAMMGDTETVMNRHYSKIREQRIAKELGIMYVSRTEDTPPMRATGTDGPGWLPPTPDDWRGAGPAATGDAAFN